jgi:hypothetical protein
MTVSVDGKSLQYSQFASILTELDFESGTTKSLMPRNFSSLDGAHGIGYNTNSNGTIAFVAPYAEGSKIYILEGGYAKEIHYASEGFIGQYINSVGEWIYYIVIPDLQERFFLNLCRIRNDGSSLEIVCENILSKVDFEGYPSIFINIFSEDIILFKTHSANHNIYALIRDADTGEFIIKAVNADCEEVLG